VRELHEIGSPATVASTGGRYFGFVIGGALPVTVAVSWLATAWDQNGSFIATSPIAAAIERVASRWLRELLQLPASTTAAFVTGGTMANFSGLAAARRALLSRAGWDVDADGLFGAPPLTVVVSDEVHITVLKALALLGLGKKRVVRVPTDDHGRMRADALPRTDGPTLVCMQAGNVNTGAFDPAGPICDWAAEKGAWVHVDGAIGLWALASPGRAQITSGLARADSWATDGHKWLNVPYDSGVVLVRDGEWLRGAMAATAEYTPAGPVPEPCHYTPEFSRRARGLEIWAALRQLGRGGVIDLIERTCGHAANIAERLRAAGFEVHNDVVLNQVLVSVGPPERTRRVVDALQRDGTCWCGATVWHGKTAMRISVSGWATGPEDVERSVEAIVRVARSER
jgi:glutamate/tyrosine decarboxylase-like PLP-dependent enzyme